MHNKNTYLFILTLLFSACATSKGPAPEGERSVTKAIESILIDHLPTRSALESQVLTGRLLIFGEPGIRKICALLQAGGDLQTKAEFALAMLAEAVTQGEHAAKRNMFNRALGKALQGDLSPENRAFLIAQLQIAGNDAVVPALAGWVSDARLADPALLALAAIGSSKAVDAMTQAYAGAGPAQKPAILQAIAFTRESQSVRFLQREAKSADGEMAKLATVLLVSRALQDEVTTPENLSAKTRPVQSAEALLKSPDATTRLTAIENLMATGDTAAVDILLLRLQATSESQEILAIEKALLHLPIHKNFAAVARALSNSSPLARAAILRVLAKRQVDAYMDDFLRLAQTDPDRPVRLAALKGLQAIGTADMVRALIDRLLQISDPVEQAAIRHTFSAIATRENAVTGATDAVLARFAVSDPVSRAELVKLLGKLGGQNALAAVVKALRDENAGLRDTAIRTLTEWPDPAAVPFLFEIAAQTENLAHHVLALRACARFLVSDSLADRRKIEIFDRGMALTRRLDEKKLFLGSLQQVRSPFALKRAAVYIEDADLGLEAALAVAKISEPERERHEEVTQREMVFALLEDRMRPEAKAQLGAYLPGRVMQNRPPEGFVALFNGVDLSGWKGLVKNPAARAKMTPEELTRAQTVADSIMRVHWFVENGVLTFDGTKFYNLCTAKDYGDFELLLDWKIEKGGDSGIYLRGAPQVQIWDPNLPNANVGSGGLYNNQKHPNTPLARADRSVGEWNTFRILMIGEKATVYLNDVLVVDDVVLENYWQRDQPIYSTGQIELQAHNSPLYFRNIFIREIPRQQPAFDGDLFNGKDLTGWQIIQGHEDGWGVKNGILFTTGKGGGWLSTTREFDNFKLDLEFRVSEGGNSGVFLRAPHEGDPAYTGMEIQVLDDYAEKYAALKPWQYTGSIYAVQPPSERVTKKAGEWQKMQIVCDGPKVSVTLNSVKIIDTNLIDHGDKERRNPGLKRRKGFIGLQNHGSLVEYRNIRLVELW